MLALLLATVASAAPVSAPPEVPALDDRRAQARDTGATLRRVDELRAVGEYQAAVDELRGYCERWRAAGIGRADIGAELARMEELLKRMLSIRDLYQRAPEDPGAAGQYLRALVDPAKPSSITMERARGIRLLARHDQRLRALLERAFPARLTVTVKSIEDADLDDVVAIALQNALVDMSLQAGLPISLDEGDATLRIEVVVRENERANTMLANTGMHSYGFFLSAHVNDADGARLLEAAQSTSGLGINPGNAVHWNMERVARQVFERIVDELAKRIERGQL
ncbi:MAG: hypothetical protein IT383_16210 [Deltaproteobacteria bacterium]|nr:hypothetical protein [Deltaproteobacteria bacterium]